MCVRAHTDVHVRAHLRRCAGAKVAGRAQLITCVGRGNMWPWALVRAHTHTSACARAQARARVCVCERGMVQSCVHGGRGSSG